MTERIEWVRASCRLLGSIADEFRDTQPFAGRTIGTGIHLEPKTVALLLTLKAGGADVVSTGNLNSTQPSAVEYLRGSAVTVIGGPTQDPYERARHPQAEVGSNHGCGVVRPKDGVHVAPGVRPPGRGDDEAPDTSGQCRTRG